MPRDSSSRPAVHYSDAIAHRVCDAVAAGKMLIEIERMPGMPLARTVHRWVAAGRGTLAEDYRRACLVRASQWAEEILDLANTATAADWKVRHLQIDTRKWLAAKFYPRMFGDRVATQQLGADGEPIDPRQNDLWARAVAKLPTEDLAELKRILEACGFGDETTGAPEPRAAD